MFVGVVAPKVFLASWLNALVKLPMQRAVAWFFLGAAVVFKLRIGYGVG
jgi:hypothetical protein